MWSYLLFYFISFYILQISTYPKLSSEVSFPTPIHLFSFEANGHLEGFRFDVQRMELQRTWGADLRLTPQQKIIAIASKPAHRECWFSFFFYVNVERKDGIEGLNSTIYLTMGWWPHFVEWGQTHSEVLFTLSGLSLLRWKKKRCVRHSLVNTALARFRCCTVVDVRLSFSVRWWRLCLIS